MPIGGEPMIEDPRLIELAQQRDANRSKAAAVAIAVLAHALIGLILAWIVLSVINDDPPELIVESNGPSDLPPNIKKEEFSKKVSNDKPSPPSESTQVIVANIASPVAVPMVEEITESPVIGDATNGLGFGGGGFGDGNGGSSFFGTSGGGQNIVIVIDTSTSMIGNCGRDGCDAIIKEVNSTISKLKAGTRFNIICFGNDADAFSKQSTAVKAETQKAAKEFMADYFQNTAWTRTRTSKFGKSGKDNKGIPYHPIMPDDIESLKGTSGGSRMDLALVAAFEQKPSTIFLIADGEPGTAKGGRKLDQADLIKLIVKEAERAYGGGTMPTVNAISVKDQGEQMLRAIAKEFKGKYKSIDPAKA
jgi:hypothetical protein